MTHIHLFLLFDLRVANGDKNHSKKRLGASVFSNSAPRFLWQNLSLSQLFLNQWPHHQHSVCVCGFVHTFGEKTAPVCTTSMTFPWMFRALYKLTSFLKLLSIHFDVYVDTTGVVCHKLGLLGTNLHAVGCGGIVKTNKLSRLPISDTVGSDTVGSDTVLRQYLVVNRDRTEKWIPTRATTPQEKLDSFGSVDTLFVVTSPFTKEKSIMPVNAAIPSATRAGPSISVSLSATTASVSGVFTRAVFDAATESGFSGVTAGCRFQGHKSRPLCVVSDGVLSPEAHSVSILWKRRKKKKKKKRWNWSGEKNNNKKTATTKKGKTKTESMCNGI